MLRVARGCEVSVQPTVHVIDHTGHDGVYMLDAPEATPMGDITKCAREGRYPHIITTRFQYLLICFSPYESLYGYADLSPE